jgi:hypothetical protein
MERSSAPRPTERRPGEIVRCGSKETMESVRLRSDGEPETREEQTEII